jgi:hypothetical protein
VASLSPTYCIHNRYKTFGRHTRNAMTNNKLEEVYNNIVKSSIEEGRLLEQIKMLKLVSTLHQQGRISDDVMHVFFLELSLDID